MCLSIPGKVISVADAMAEVDIGGLTYSVGTDTVDCVRVGDFVLVHAGYILDILDPVQAQQTIADLHEIWRLVGEEHAGLEERRKAQSVNISTPDGAHG